ncbi:pyridoxal phosphate-dependent transferase [Halteromyces radiatus]|uniref:pyridoxal phosphate-dependent transferase n=1 Tax=Halteromyces radiatus TaxID=101107 RepID=UPI00221F9D32|nr:pyridoxal phosphate-dependent transferase [Halteromyces radiatus]KAI8086164.1 pyridoxal phosphate-dependent transferase [Halteromyces radiatus]
MIMSMAIKSKPILVKQAVCRYLSTSPVQRLYIQNNLHNDQTHTSQPAMDPNAKLYDFRSDTVTAPTDEMFEVMKKATRNDSVFEEDDSVHELERHVADLTGHEAGLFCASGTMTNQLGLRVHLTQPPHSVVCDARSHVHLWEAGGIAFHSRASVSPVIPRNGVHVTATEIEGNLIEPDLHTAPTRVVSLENTLSGMVMPLQDMQEIAALARDRGLAMHLDGARLWNAHVASGVPLHEYGKCFDSMSLCLSKGVGAPIGSMLVGNRKFIDRARHFRKLFGGGWRQAGSIAAAAKYCIDTVVPTMDATHALTRYLADQLVSLDIDLQNPVHTNMVLIDTARVGLNIQKDVAPALLRKNIKIGGMGSKSRIVLHHQIDKEGVDLLLSVFREVLAQHNTRKFQQEQELASAEA